MTSTYIIRNAASAQVSAAHSTIRHRITALHTRRRAEKFVLSMSYFSLLRFRKKFSAALMSMMNKNSTSAMENSACRCSPAAA